MKKEIHREDPTFTILDIYKIFGEEKIEKFIRTHKDRKRTDLSRSWNERMYKRLFGVDHPRVTANVLKRMKNTFKKEHGIKA